MIPCKNIHRLHYALHDYRLFIAGSFAYICEQKTCQDFLFQVQFRPKRKLKKKIKQVLSSVNREAESASPSEPNSTTFQGN